MPLGMHRPRGTVRVVLSIHAVSKLNYVPTNPDVVLRPHDARACVLFVSTHKHTQHAVYAAPLLSTPPPPPLAPSPSPPGCPPCFRQSGEPLDEGAMYVWRYDRPTSLWFYVAAVAVPLLVIGACLFPLAPYWARVCSRRGRRRRRERRRGRRRRRETRRGRGPHLRAPPRLPCAHCPLRCPRSTCCLLLSPHPPLLVHSIVPTLGRRTSSLVLTLAVTHHRAPSLTSRVARRLIALLRRRTSSLVTRHSPRSAWWCTCCRASSSSCSASSPCATSSSSPSGASPATTSGCSRT